MKGKSIPDDKVATWLIRFPDGNVRSTYGSYRYAKQIAEQIKGEHQDGKSDDIPECGYLII